LSLCTPVCCKEAAVAAVVVGIAVVGLALVAVLFVVSWGISDVVTVLNSSSVFVKAPPI